MTRRSVLMKFVGVPALRHVGPVVLLIGFVATSSLSAANLAAAQWREIAGEVETPIETLGSGTSIRLRDAAGFGWRTGTFSGSIDLNGQSLLVETGGGNRIELSGVISGAGEIRWNGGGSPEWQIVPSFLSGGEANSMTGSLTVLRGTLALAKPAGVAAFSGERLVVGGGANQAILRLDAAEQIVDHCRFEMVGDHPARLWTQGHHETLGPMLLKTYGTIDLGDRACRLEFADSRLESWDLTKTLTITNWKVDQDELVFGDGVSGLTVEQLARVGFLNPSDRAEGLYRAIQNPNGSLVPGELVEAIDPPFDVTSAARAARAEIFSVEGLAALSGVNTPLQERMTVSFFGDSITWQNGYLSKIEQAIETGVGSRELQVRLINRGINGGGVLQVRDGSSSAAYVSPENQDGSQEAFAKVIAEDRADVAVVFIGINDVWWRETSASDFEQALRELVKQANEQGTRLVLATVTVSQELPEGSNSLDSKCDQYAEITRSVAMSTETTLVDLRRVWLAYLQNHNAELRVDGSLAFQSVGVLTYDGIHPNETGNKLLAEHLSDGIVRALNR